ncbi:MAG: thermonuclease family protein [Hyphomicrobiaceae bacterium]
MFFWRRRKEGFEWHKYVRTTIKLRREARREKADMLKRQAADGVKVAGAVAGDAARAGARKLGAGSRIAAAFASSWLGRLLRGLAAGSGRLVRSVVDGARLLVRTRLGIPAFLGRLGPRTRPVAMAAMGLAALGLVSAMAGLAGFNVQRLAGMTPSLPFSASSTRAVEGRATVLSPDTLRVGTATVRLAEIEAPSREQRCSKAGNKRWRCGDAAMVALGKLANGRALRCEIRSTDVTGTVAGVCFDKDVDINAALVKGGHVFAVSGLMSRYGKLEGEARTVKAGLWSGEAERPSAYRARMWEEAKRRAPDGCPIKGQVNGNSRSYVMPWSPDYERIRVNTQRGGRWFCSEQDALAAGWKVKLASGI